MDIPLETIRPLQCQTQAGALRQKIPIAGNGDGAAHSSPDETETDALISVQVVGGNGETTPSGHEADTQRIVGNTSKHREKSSMCRIQEELNKVVFWRVRLWMVIVFISLLIIAVILISLGVCSVIQEDTDETFDSSLFTVPLRYNGSFQLPNLDYTEELLTFSSKKSQTLAADFQKKLGDLYRASPALGRYFSRAEIYAFRNGSVIADYQLTFLMPEEQQDQLRKFTLSREMVYNVFRQCLYDQEPDESDPMYIDPVSLNMFLTQ